MKLPCFGIKFSKKSDQKQLLKNQMLHKEQSVSLLDNKQQKKTAAKSAKVNNCSLQNIADFVDIGAQTSSWYLPAVSAEKSAEILEALPAGRFVIRKFKNSFILHLRTPAAADTPMQTYLLSTENGGVCFAGQNKTFSCLSSLVVHHSIMQEHLPTTLVVAEHQAADDSIIDFIDIDVEPDFSDLVSSLQTQIKF